MQGQVLRFRADLGVGVIRADDGRTYRFVCSDVINPDAGLVGRPVDFLVDTRRPRAILVTDTSPWTVFGGARAASQAGAP